MIDKVKKILGLSSRKTGNKLILSVEKLESRVALLENGRLEGYSVERKNSRNIVGSVYKGKVRNIEMGLKAMFVDIGFEKNAFLHFWDAIPGALDSGIEEIDRSANKRPRKRITAKDIPNIYPVGSEVIVQVTKGPIGTKGPRVTTNLSFAGRYLVLMPFSDRSGISRKIEDPRERERLRQISRRARNRVRFYDSATPIFETYGVQKQIDDAFHRQVWLKCGGYIVIDETEALVAIDVNTGRNKGGRNVEKTILQTNLEAADE